MSITSLLKKSKTTKPKVDMTTLAQAFAQLPINQQQDMVNQYLGGKLFSAIGLSSDEPEEIKAKLAEVQSVRESKLLAALSEDMRAKTLSLSDDAEDLLNTPTE